MTAPASTRPAPGVPRPYHFPTFTRTQVDSGLRVIACHLPGRRVGSARLVMEGGISREPAELAGAATLAARTVTEGTESMDAAAFAEATEQLGADISVDAGWDSIQGSVVVPVSRLEPALALLSDAVLHPTFPPNEVARLKSERLNDIKQEYADPNQRAHMAFVNTIYTPESPFSRPSGGSAATVSRLDRDAIEAHFRRYAGPQDATLIVAGDLEGFDAAAVADRLFGAWKGGAPAPATPPVAEALTATSVNLVHRPGAVQSSIIVGHVGVPRLVPDFLPTTLMVSILGGLFTSRLNLKLREEKGYTYGARAWFDFRRNAGPFGAATAVATGVTVEAIDDTLTEIRRLHAEGVTPEELAFAKDYLVGIFPLAFETPEAISQAISRMVVYGLPDDYYQTYRAAMQAVTVEEASQAATEHLRPERIAIVAVGDPDLEGPLEEAGFGPLTVTQDSPDVL
ncbi:MAG TPA: pitrilysin family protein [Actinomycetota bacterium]|nr:pitrilysin family protein [Actinomycetota bacterium]